MRGLRVKIASVIIRVWGDWFMRGVESILGVGLRGEGGGVLGHVMNHMVILGVVGRGHSHADQLTVVAVGGGEGYLGEGVVLHNCEGSRDIGGGNRISKLLPHLEGRNGRQGCHRLEGGKSGVVVPLWSTEITRRCHSSINRG
jgi:hypothetical protein